MNVVSETQFAECWIKKCHYVGHNDTFITNNHGIMQCPICNGNATQPIEQNEIPQGCLLVGEDEYL